MRHRFCQKLWHLQTQFRVSCRRLKQSPRYSEPLAPHSDRWSCKSRCSWAPFPLYNQPFLCDSAHRCIRCSTNSDWDRTRCQRTAFWKSSCRQRETTCFRERMAYHRTRSTLGPSLPLCRCMSRWLQKCLIVWLHRGCLDLQLVPHWLLVTWSVSKSFDCESSSLQWRCRSYRLGKLFVLVELLGSISYW